MGAPQPTASEYFAGTTAPTTPNPRLPTAEQFFNNAQPLSGAAHDTIWSSLQSAGARILNSVGYGAADNWGARPLGLDPDTEGALRKAGIFSDYQAGHDTILKAANEALIRPAEQAADLVARLPGAVLGGIQGGAEQSAQEIEGKTPGTIQKAIAYPFHAAGEAAQEVAGGALGELPGMAEGGRLPEVAEAERVSTAATARAVGVVGEGEAGFYGAEPITPENLAARTEAAKDAGIEPPPPQPPALDIHALARRIDPDTFEQYGALALERDQQRQTLGNLISEREKTPEALQAQADIDDIVGGGSAAERPSRVEAVRASAPEAVVARLDDAQRRLDTALQTDTPEMAEARSKMLDADFAMRDLAPQVSRAYREAQDMAPAAAEVAQEAPGGPKQETAAATTAQPEAQAEGAEGQPHTIPAEASAEAAEEAGLAPPSITGEQKLGAGTEVERLAESAAKPPTARYGNLRATEGTGDVVTRGLSEGVEARAIEDGLTSTFGDLPEYRQLSMADQAAKASDLINTDYDTAKAVAMGDRQPPKGLLPESVFVGVEKRALAEGDVDTLRQLATRSRLSTAATTMGQRIRTLGERDPASPVGALQEVQKAREADVSKRMDIDAAKRETVEEIRSEVRGAASKADAWRDFLGSIECGE